MSSTQPNADVGPSRLPGRGVAQRAGAAGAVIALAIVALVVFAHAVRSNPSKAAAASNSHPAASSGSSMSMGASGSTASSSSSSGSTAMPSGTGGVMTIRQTALPVMQSSGAMPVAMAMVPIGISDWQGMKIMAQTSAPATFQVFNGTSTQLVRPTARDSFHLMVMLSDEHTNVAIPYSSVWATITKGSRIVFDERLWPMISAYMGPHYGNNVQIGGAGLYHLTLLVSPPVAARHLEYKGLWLKPHRVKLAFRWVPKT